MWRNRCLIERMILFSTSSSSSSLLKPPNPNFIIRYFSSAKTLNPNKTLSPSFYKSRVTDSVKLSGITNPSIARARSSAPAPSVHTLDWKEPVPVLCSEAVEDEFGSGNEEETEMETRPAIPVRAHFFSTSIDLKGLVDQNKSNFILPTSRMTNYIVLRFSDSNIESTVSLGD
ncbi:hypothetical protein GIB67_002252 [Kingdonia uniflora]|uniref:Uncharacterized protein n=1 Tax=Kingdonia uniflora TaxID=39325 RepID=A0A7J7KWW1_9MAGN|nr:hypothetical protein GIB67_002252 [Kingdonia uniflora]